NDKKDVEGYAAEVLGLVIDTITMELRLSPEKLRKTRTLLKRAMRLTPSTTPEIPLVELQRLTGFLNFCAKAVPLGRTFLRRLWAATTGSPSTSVPLTPAMLLDMSWWLQFLDSWAGCFWSVDEHSHENIAVLELRAIELALHLWGPRWSQCHLVIYTDNKLAFHGLSSRDTRMGGLLPPIPHQILTLLPRTRNFKAYAGWCRSQGLLPPYFPADPRLVEQWLVARAEERNPKPLQPATISAGLTGLISYHTDRGITTDFRTPRIKRILAGITRILGVKPTRERAPLTRDLLLKIFLSSWPPSLLNSNHVRLTIAASFAVAFTGFLRVGEFTYTARDLDRPDFHLLFLTRASVSISSTGDVARLLLPRSKTDPNRGGIPIYLARADDVFCPVRLL
ncbi:hypothetical protein BJ508DRAFT_197806, partial [Ascobolus immersus RN42]